MITLNTANASNSLALQANNSNSNSGSEQSTEETSQSGPYITVEDPQSGYKYIYVVIGKNFRQLISCEPMDKKDGTKDNKNVDKVKNEQTKAAGSMPLQNSICSNNQAFLAQHKDNNVCKENLIEKIRIWEQCALLNKSEASTLDRRG